MTFSFFSIIVLFGAVQGLLIALYLIFSSSADKSQKNILAFFMLILAYNGFETTAWSTGFADHYVFFDLFNFTLIFGLGPAVFLYVRSFQKKFSRKDFLHFAFPFFLLITRFLYIVYFILSAYKITPPIDYHSIEDWRWAILEPLSAIVFSIYVYFSISEFRKMNPGVTELTPESYSIVYTWLRRFLVCMFILAIVWIISLLAAWLLNIKNGLEYYLVEILLAIFIYWVGLMGYQRIKIVYINLQKNNQTLLKSLTTEEIDSCKNALQRAMNVDKFYLDPTLTVSGMAVHVGFSAKLISAVLNQELKKGFNEYVNEYRLFEFKERAAKTNWQHLTISGLAAECGFNSQATFQRIFKQSTGVSPSEYLKTISRDN